MSTSPQSPQEAPPTPNLGINDLLRIMNESALGIYFRQHSIKQLEDKIGGKMVIYVANTRHPNAMMHHGDAALIETLLRKMGKCEKLAMVVHSDGGIGEAAEKIIDLCRHYCDEFRVLVPMRAKSAATLLTFGADRIVMGFCSELGPIDAQISIVEGNVRHYISAQNFIDVRDDLVTKIQEAEKTGQTPSQAWLVQLASLNKAFVLHCQRQQDYVVDFAKRWLPRHMLKDLQPKDALAKAEETAKNLLSRGTFSHGQMIPARELKPENGIHLQVDELQRDTDVWKTLWNLYSCCDVLFNIPAGQNI